MVCYHPLYNIFSTVTLGFCSALTHSLLNVGKRVYAILVAIVWFREDFSGTTEIGLLLVVNGGMWYTHESKRSKKTQSSSNATAITGEESM